MKKLSTFMPKNTSIQSRTVQARSKSARKKSPLAQSIAPLSLSLSLSLAIMTTALGTTLAPNNALASSVASETDSSNQTKTYNDKFKDFIYAYDENDNPKIDIMAYYIWAGNVGDATQLNTFSTGNASTNNNILYVYDGAGIYDDSALTSSGAYTINGAAGHIALKGETATVTATDNATIMDATYSETNLTGYIANLTGAYININTYSFTSDDKYIKTTVDTVTASDNSVILQDGTVGVGWMGASGNTQNTLQDNVGSYLTGAYVESSNINSSAQFNLYNNSVLIEGGLVLENIGRSLENGALAGAYVSTITGNATMSGNSVTITGGDVQATTISGAVFVASELSTSILGSAYKDKDLYELGGYTNNNSTATMFNNSVTIANPDADFTASLISGAYSSATSTSTVYNNSVTISGGEFISNSSSGDLAPLYITGAYIAPQQWIEVNTVGDYGTLVTPDGTTVNMKAYDNSVTITGGTIEGTVAGATIIVSTKDTLKAQLTYNGSISNNTVNIYGGTIAKADINTTYYSSYNGIYGGVYQGDYQDDGSVVHNYSITNNTVNIGFDAIVASEVNIGGGAYNDESKTEPKYFELTPNANTYDGNTLNLYHLNDSTVSANTVANFENINFVLGAGDSSQFKNSAIIAISDTLYLGNGYSDSSDVTEDYDTVATKYANFGLHTSLYNTLQNGESVTLFTAGTIDGYFTNLGTNNSGTYTGTHGALLSRTWNIQTDATTNTMTATLLSTQAGEQAKVLGEVSLGGVVAVNASADLVVSGAISAAQLKMEALQQSGGASSNDVSVVGYMVSSVGTSRYETGSHVDSDTISLHAGAAYGGTGNNGDWLLGAFLEYTHGDYSTYNSFSSGSVNGEGGVEAFGIGGFARFDFDVSSDFAWGMKPYAEASLRLGFVETDFATADLQDYSATNFNSSSVAYEVNHAYMGAHLGFGGEYQVSDIHTVDVALRYFWTHQFHDNENILGHDIEYHAIDSHRVRLNGRSTYALQRFEKFGTFNVYGGFGLEYEFDGEARTTVDGYAADAPDLQGFTVLTEIGFNFTPIDKQPLTVDLGLQSYLGKREGLGATLQMMYGF